MKKSVFLLGLMTTAICLSACGSKNFNMSFEEALELASHSSIQDVMANADNAEQSVNIAGSYNKDDTKVDVKLNSHSKQNLKDIQSESNISIDLKLQESENKLDLKGDLDIKFVPSTIYLSLNSLDIKGDESTEGIAGIVSGFLNQWFSIPLGEAIDLNSFSMKDQFELSSKIKDVINNEGFQVYNGKFKDYNGYNARKISIDDEKLIKILKDYYNPTNNIINDVENETTTVAEEIENSDNNSEEISDENIGNNAENNTENDIENVAESSTENSTENGTELSTENNEEIVTNNENNDEISIENLDSELNNVKIENFEGYLIIIGKDKVALAIENMDITENGTTTNLNGLFSDKDNSLNVFSEGEEVITLTAKRKGSHFNVNLNLSGLCLVEGTITPKISSSKIDIDFNLSITIKSDDDSTIIPLKGSRSYAPISEYTVEIPSDSQDLTQMLGGMLGGLYGGSNLDYSDYDDYSDYELDAENSYNQELNDEQTETTDEEIAENTEEITENIEETNAE